MKQIIKNIKDRIHFYLRAYYEKRVSLSYGISRFLSNIAFIQLTHEERIDMGSVSNIGGLWVTTQGIRPVLNYSVFVAGGPDARFGMWVAVQVFMEDKRPLQLRIETEESRLARLQAAETMVKNALWMSQLPEPKFADTWEMTDINNPHIAPLRDMFLGFALYAPLIASMKRKIN